MIKRDIQEKLIYFTEKYPVVTLTGPRQCGKSTLLKKTFPHYNYVSLEDPDLRLFAEADPRGFLNGQKGKTVIDEVQNVPQLFSYIQTRVDKENKPGLYILSGSHNFLLMQGISQSLAGRTAILKMQPFSLNEITNAGVNIASLDELLFTGLYPRIYDQKIKPHEFYPFYIQTHLEKDVRLLRNINDLSLFTRFIKLCAGRVGQMLNISSLANDAGINVLTVQAWLSILEASYIIFLLKPHHQNYNKRLVKSPKLYFYDTGLVASLLGMNNSEQMSTHYLRGSMFENWVIVEHIKNSYAQAIDPNIFFWRDSNGNEIDLIIEKGLETFGVEIKSAQTFSLDYAKGLLKWKKLSDKPIGLMNVVYGGETPFLTEKVKFIPWKLWRGI